MALAGTAPWQVLIPDLTDTADINVGIKQFYEGYGADAGIEDHIVTLAGRIDDIETSISEDWAIDFKDNFFAIADNTTPSKRLTFQLSTISSGTIELSVPPASDTIVGVNATQTLQNKTLSAATINANSQIDNSPIGSNTAASVKATTLQGTDATDVGALGTGAAIFAGGMSIAKGLRVGGALQVDGSTTGLNADLLDGQHASAFALSGHTHSYQPLDADLTAIAALAGTSGFLKKTATDTWALDTTVYAPIASPTFTGTATSPMFAASGNTGATQASRYAGATAGGAPASGTYAVGDFIIDRANARIYICTAAGTPGTWALAGASVLTQTYATALPSAGSYPEGTIIVRY